MHAASPRGRRAPCRPAAASPCHGRQKQVPWPMPRHSDRAHTSICGIGIAPISCSFHAALWRCMHVWALAAIASCGGGLHRPAVIGEYLFRALDTTPTAKSNSNCKRLKREKLPDHKFSRLQPEPIQHGMKKCLHALTRCRCMRAVCARGTTLCEQPPRLLSRIGADKFCRQGDRSRPGVRQRPVHDNEGRCPSKSLCSISAEVHRAEGGAAVVLMGAGILGSIGCCGSDGAAVRAVWGWWNLS